DYYCMIWHNTAWVF
nr:immunoglobulin light chain junction region [Macaca mulatta]MOY07653.1 immunoglobulin light chain junction region [Macaca mulatta]MOY08482.1 immunoglobulin light chain junction region [Macaca mulatta]